MAASREPKATRRKPVIGIVGGVGSGKSCVAAEFGRHVAALISGDQLGHEALRQPAIRSRVLERFGQEVVDAKGEIDRHKLGAMVFADPGALRALEVIVFPAIERGIAERIADAQGNPDVSLIVLDAAVMLEAGWNKFCDKIVYIHAPREQRLQRLARQRGWTAKEAQARMQAQWPLTDKVTRADAAIDNSGPPEALAQQVAQVLNCWSFGVAT
jgi:dephospho-CoA kinase